MAIDRWFIGGGAEHTQESARRLTYATTGGSEGVCGVSDLQVLPLETPGQGVRVVTGSALIRSNYVGGETQTYMGTVYVQEEVPTSPSSSTPGGRSDLVVMRVEDPFAAGSPWPEPAPEDIATAQYIYIRVISGVPAGTTSLQSVPGHENDTAVALARIDFPPSTGTVTSGMIKDLRKVAQPRRADAYIARKVPTGSSGTANNVIGQWQVFPPNLTGGQVVVPEWATWVELQAEWSGVWAGPGVAHVDSRVAMSLGGTHLGTSTMGYFDNSANQKTLGLIALGGSAVPESFRGQTVYITPDIRLSADQQAGALPRYHEWCAVKIIAHFYESRSDQIVAI